MTRSCFPDDRDVVAPRPVAQIDGMPDLFSPLGDSTRPAQRPEVRKAEQRSLELERSIDADYAAWLATPAGQSTYGKIRDRALISARAGNSRVGIKACAERVRWEEKVHVDNRFVSRIARDLVDREPDLKDKVQLRQLESAGSVSE